MADITGLDVVGIPVYQAIVPASDDRISTYSGKGLHSLAAKVSAAMEAYERFYGNHPPDVDGVFSLNHAVQSGWPVLDPRDGAVEVRATYTDDDPIAWAWGYDIGREMAVLVPAEQFSSSYVNPGSPVFDLVTTNGLASGNNLTEAILHGLYEVIERDAWTIADVLGQRLARPGRSRRVGRGKGRRQRPRGQRQSTSLPFRRGSRNTWKGSTPRGSCLRCTCCASTPESPPASP